MCRTRTARAARTSMARWQTRHANCAASITCAKIRGRPDVALVVRVRASHARANRDLVVALAVRWGWASQGRIVAAANVRNAAISSRPAMNTDSHGRRVAVSAVDQIRIAAIRIAHPARVPVVSHVPADHVRMAQARRADVLAGHVPAVRVQVERARAARVQTARLRMVRTSRKPIQMHFAVGTCPTVWIRDPSRHRHAAHPRVADHPIAAPAVEQVFHPITPTDTNAARKVLASIVVVRTAPESPIPGGRMVRVPLARTVRAMPGPAAGRVVRVPVRAAAGRVAGLQATVRKRVHPARARSIAARGPVAAIVDRAMREPTRVRLPGRPTCGDQRQ